MAKFPGADTLEALRRWFFAKGDARTAAALRIGFCAIYIFVLWDFYPVMHVLFGVGGLYEPVANYNPAHLPPLALLYKYPSGGALELWFWSSVVVATLALFGFASRLTTALTYASLLLFQSRGNFIIFGADLVLRMIGLWLLFLKTGQVWSVDAWLRRRFGRTASEGLLIEHWPVKAIQIQCAGIYLITFLCKISTKTWQDGSAVYYALQVGDVMFGQAFAYLKSFRAFFPVMTYGTLVMEGGFFFLVFRRSTRNLALLSGFLMHSGIDVLMSIRFFALAMYLGYVAFLDREDWVRLFFFRRELPVGLSAR